MSSKGKIPKLVVFDLDYTLWPFWVDTHVNPPFRKTNGKIVDTSGTTIKFYPEVPQVLQKLTEMNVPIGVASRTSEIQGAEQLCELFDWNKYFKYKEIYPGSKVAHFNQFKKYTDFEFEDMLFFDDEHRNIKDLTKLNVTSILVKNGMTMKALEEGLQVFANKKFNSLAISRG
ncbi:magnesium-dependent phosphatase 1-like isoform X1 [Rhodnius prolixus]